MSATLHPDEIKFLQGMLCSAGCYTGPKNGVWSQAVDDAEAQLATIADQLATALGRTFPDFPHYQLAIGGASITDVRTCFEKGAPFVPA